jgi:uncharacterized protein YndB with AHSA1/START domain
MKQIPPITEPVVFECDLPDSREKVWRALTERELLGAWLMPNDIRPEVGAKFQLRPARDAGPCVPVECEILEAESGRRLRWRQQEQCEAVASQRFVESVVTFELADIPNGGTHLRIVHDGFTSGVTQQRARGALRTESCAGVIPFRARGFGAHRGKTGPVCLHYSSIGLRRAA